MRERFQQLFPQRDVRMRESRIAVLRTLARQLRQLMRQTVERSPVHCLPLRHRRHREAQRLQRGSTTRAARLPLQIEVIERAVVFDDRLRGILERTLT